MTLDKKYHDDLLAAMRFHEISGERAGEVLAEIDAHVSETGEDPNEVFGRPRDYAKQVAAQLDSSTGKRSTGETVLWSVVAGFLGMFGPSLLGSGMDLSKPEVGFSMRDVVAQPVLLVIIVIGVLLFFRAYTASSHNKLFAGGAVLAAIAGIGSQVAANMALDEETPVVSLPTWLVLGLGVVFLIALAVLLTTAIRRNRVVYPTKR
ncbi:hypothetical protein GCM10009854_13870 [Saccharopolyspora halophila]|uniref:DUF1700 domain-containing protein n=2 Tax=Saccharopolyspora halophila TaxID=405551 RepID=A0ABN3FWG4_9PSEU